MAEEDGANARSASALERTNKRQQYRMGVRRPRQLWWPRGWTRSCRTVQCHPTFGLTEGIEHKRKKQKVVVEYSCGSRLRTNKCTTDQVLLKTADGKKMSSGRYCKMCYRNQPQGLSKAEKKANCRTSISGCGQCKETICTECWELGYDRHQVGNVID